MEPRSTPAGDESSRPAAARPRPLLHFTPAKNWMNDPNGLVFWRDRYHLFYQHNPFAPHPARIHWGHAVSDDLLHWNHLPTALAPDPGGPDADGCWSGDAVIQGDVPHLVYTGVRGETQRPCLATATDFDQLTTWQKHPGNPVIAEPPPGYGARGFRDHCVWREGDFFYQLIASGRDDRGAVLLYRSDDLVRWEYLHPLLTAASPELGVMWECPDFFRLGDRYVLVVSAMGATTAAPVLYFVGPYANGRFSPETQGVLDRGSRFYAPQSLADRHDRRVVFGWLREQERELDETSGHDWIGWMSLPRLLSLGPEGNVLVAPLPDLRAQRGRQTVAPPGVRSLRPQGDGSAFELMAEVEITSEAPIDLRVRYRDPAHPPVVITVDPGSGDIRIRTQSSAPPTSGRPKPLSRPRHCSLQVFLDQGSVEVFADGIAATELFHPADARFAEAEVIIDDRTTSLRSLVAWQVDQLPGRSGFRT